MTQQWLNKDGLFIRYGSDQATVANAGEYKSFGANRVLEVKVDLSTLNTSSAVILDYGTFFPAGDNIYIESVELIAEVGMSTASSPTLSVGIIEMDQSTVPSSGGTAFVNAQAAAGLSTAGDKIILYASTTSHGGYIGNYKQATPQGYLTAQLGTATATGTIRVRINYHGVGTISS